MSSIAPTLYCISSQAVVSAERPPLTNGGGAAKLTLKRSSTSGAVNQNWREEILERRTALKLMGATAAMAGAGLIPGRASAADKITIALIPGLTSDGFYITMHKGAEAAAKAVGAELIYQGAAEWNVSLQVPILDAIIAKKPGAILIAPTDKTQLIKPLRKAFDAGITVVCVDTFIGNGVFQTGSGDADFPISYVASDNVLGGRMAARALAKAIGEKGKVYVSNVKPGVSTTDQREEGFKLEMKNYPNISVLETQFNDDDANKAAAQVQAVMGRVPDLAGVFGANLFSADRHRQRRQAGGQGRHGQDRRLRRARIGRRPVEGRHLRTDHRPAPGRDRLFRLHSRLRSSDRQSRPDRDRHRLHRHDQRQYRRSRTSRKFLYKSS